MTRLRLAAAALVAIACTALMPTLSQADSSGGLTVTVIGPADVSNYPTVAAHVSVVDANGRPATDLAASSFSVSDDAGPAPVISAASNPTDAPGAYIILVDESATMTGALPNGQTYLQAAQDVANQVITSLGPNDDVRLVAFNRAVDSRTPWLHPGDTDLAGAIAKLTTANEPKDIAAALQATSAYAAAPPAEATRRAVVVLTDVVSGSEDAPLSVDSMKALGAPVYVVGLRATATADARLNQFMADVARYTNGSYQSLSTASTADVVKNILAVQQSAWQVTFTAAGQPDGSAHGFTVSATRESATGSGTGTYTSGALTAVSKVLFQGIADGDHVSSDRDITASLAPGGPAWDSYQLALYRDCQPSACKPIDASTNRDVTMKLSVGGMSQGAHQLLARLTVTRGQNTYTGDYAVAFERTGTTFNLAAMFLFGGLAVAAIGATGIAIRRKPSK